MQPSQTFILPYERAAQLRMILEAKQKSFSDYISDLIHTEIAAGHLSPEVPEVHIKAESVINDNKTIKGLLIGFADLQPAFLPKETALKLSAALKAAADQTTRFVETQEDGLFRVARQSKGVRVTLPLNNQTRKYNASLTKDIATQIDSVLNKEQ